MVCEVCLRDLFVNCCVMLYGLFFVLLCVDVRARV